MEIWRDTDPDSGERWLDMESWMPGAPAPYMQRIRRLRAEPDGTILARRYTLPEAARHVGAWQDPRAFDSLQPAQLVELAGCDATITRAGAGRFECGTTGHRRRNAYEGAAYAISQPVLTTDEMVNWDRGFSETGDLVWGPATDGYRFRRVGEAAQRFWNSDEYAEIRKLREGIADSGVLVLPVPRIPK